MFQHLLWHSPGLIPIAIGASVLIVAMVVWMYWPQVRSLRGPWRWVLPALRGMALVVLGISIIRPVVVRPRTPAERGAIVVLIDRSPSMSVVDMGRTPSQLVSLAQGLGMLPRGIRPRSAAKLDTTSDALRGIVNDLFFARGQLDYARIAGQSTDSAEQRLADLSRRIARLADDLSDFARVNQLCQNLSDIANDNDTPADEWARQVARTNEDLTTAIAQAQTAADNALYRSNDQVRQACDDLSGISRLSIVDRALTSPESRVLPRLLSQAPVFGFSFADEVTPVPLEDHRGAVETIGVASSGVRSDLTGALRAVRQKLQGQSVQAIVLFSDGRQTAPESGLSQVLASESAPIFTIDCAGPVQKDVAVLRMTSPASAFVGQSAMVRVEVRGVGMKGSPVDVVLQADGKKLTRSIELDDENAASAEFAIRFEHPGEQTVVASIPRQPAEATLLNNRITRQIKVVADKVKVLAVTGWPGWDFQYLMQTMRRSEFIEARDQILTLDAPKLAATPQQILQQDVVILSDIRADSLSPDQCVALVKLVDERGGSVIMIPGDPKNLAEVSQLPGMSQLLPFNDVQDAAWRVWPGEDPYFQLDIAPGAQSSDALRLADDPAANAERWSQLGGVFRFMPVADARQDVRPLLVERDSELPVLTQMRVGAGRAFFFGVRETWRWRAHDRGEDQERFWLQLARFAARPRSSGDEPKVTEESMAELANVAGDEPRLRRIATSTGGEMLHIDDVADLPGKIREAGERLPGLAEYPIWDSGYLFAFVVGCFGVEWAIRKRAGLV